MLVFLSVTMKMLLIIKFLVFTSFIFVQLFLNNYSQAGIEQPIKFDILCANLQVLCQPLPCGHNEFNCECKIMLNSLSNLLYFLPLPPSLLSLTFQSD